MFVCPKCPPRADGQPGYTTESRRAFRRHLLHAGLDFVRRSFGGSYRDVFETLSPDRLLELRQKKRQAQRHSRPGKRAELSALQVQLTSTSSVASSTDASRYNMGELAQRIFKTGSRISRPETRWRRPYMLTSICCMGGTKLKYNSLHEYYVFYVIQDGYRNRK